MYSELLLRAGVERNNSTAIYKKSVIKEELELSLDGEELDAHGNPKAKATEPFIEIVQEEQAEIVQNDSEGEDEEFVEKEQKRESMRPSFYLNKINDALNDNASDNSVEDMRQSFAPPVLDLEEEAINVKELAEVKSLYEQLSGLRQSVEDEEDKEHRRRISTELSLAKIKSLIEEADKTSAQEEIISSPWTPKCESKKLSLSEFYK